MAWQPKHGHQQHCVLANVLSEVSVIGRMHKLHTNAVQDVDIKKMLAGHQGILLEFLQWMCKYLESKPPAASYDPAARRAASKHGGCNTVPRYGVSKEAFRRWRMQGIHYFPLRTIMPLVCIR